MENKTAAVKDRHRLHEIVWRIVHIIAIPIVYLRFGFRGVRSDVKGPFLLVSNHNTDWDPVLLCSCFSSQMYFVASEHLLRAGLAGRIVNFLTAPIPRQKSANASGTVMSMLRHLKKGYSVAVFPEGNRSWDGVTQEILPSIGKLARTAGVSLVTYRLQGCYLASPRWSGNSARRGRCTGSVQHIYSPEELKAMTPEEVLRHIEEDIHEDACASARRDPVCFRSRRSAEHLERLLFLCPACGRQNTLESRGDTVSCWKCGFSFRYLPTGFLSGKDIPHDNLRDWSRWQDEEIFRLCDEADEHPIFSDRDMRCDRVESAKGLVPVGKGDLKLYRDRVELPGTSIALDELTGVAIVGAQDIYFTAGEESYLVRSSMVRCVRKYLTACSYLTGKNYGV